jgi:hypothetical protein
MKTPEKRIIELYRSALITAMNETFHMPGRRASKLNKTVALALKLAKKIEGPLSRAK